MHETAVETDDNRTCEIITLLQSTTVVGHKKSIKIIDLINSKQLNGTHFYSIEVTPMKQIHLDFNEFVEPPLFTAVTWLSDTNVNCPLGVAPPSVDMSDIVSQSTPVMLHLSCYKLSHKKLDDILRLSDLTNVMALRGDFVDPTQPMQHASELVDYIHRKNDGICIAVGGYPDVHPEAISAGADINFLKHKVDAGARFVITQTCFSATVIIDFVLNCRTAGITVPILAGIFVPYSFKSLLKMCAMCKVTVPQTEFDTFKRFRDDEKSFRQFAIDNAVKMINALFSDSSASICGVHFFTLNRFDLIQKVVRQMATAVPHINVVCRSSL